MLNHSVKTKKVEKSDEEWKKELSPEEYRVLREKGTERPFTGRYYKKKDRGVYMCAGCGSELFSSQDKYDSGSGWPSFTRSHSSEAVEFADDRSHGMRRTEVLCSSCRGHLGHVFSDNPRQNGRRFCINSAALKFEERTNK